MKKVSKTQAIAVMVSGGVLFVLAIIIPTEQGSKAQLFKIGIGALGLIIAGFGSYIRPTRAPAAEK